MAQFCTPDLENDPAYVTTPRGGGFQKDCIKPSRYTV
jgi:hypothetical protein